jgi:hypothetical protein
MTSKRLLRYVAAISAAIVFVTLFSVGFASPTLQKMDRLIVYGDEFMFGVKEPEGWQGDTERAGSLKVNILFYPRGPLPSNLDGVIRVRVNKKTDENIAEDLAADMNGYRKNFSAVRFEDFEVSHSLYKCYPKLFFVEGDFHEYVTYVNPGERFWYMFSVAMGTGKSAASDAQLDAFRTVTASLLAMGGKGAVAKGAGDFDAALKAADENLKSKNGEKYDVAFARKAGPWLSSALVKCTKGLPTSDLEPFTVLVCVAESGIVEEVMVRPATKVALCLKPLFASKKAPKAPGPSWWVKMDIAIR